MMEFFFFNVKRSFFGGLEDKAFKRMWDQGREYPTKRSSELRIGLPGVVFNQTVQHLVFISPKRTCHQGSYQGMSVFILRIGLCASELTPCLKSRAKVSLSIILVCKGWWGGGKTFPVPGRCPAHLFCQRRRSRSFPKEVLSSEEQGRIPIPGSKDKEPWNAWDPCGVISPWQNSSESNPGQDYVFS